MSAKLVRSSASRRWVGWTQATWAADGERLSDYWACTLTASTMSLSPPLVIDRCGRPAVRFLGSSVLPCRPQSWSLGNRSETISEAVGIFSSFRSLTSCAKSPADAVGMGRSGQRSLSTTRIFIGGRTATSAFARWRPHAHANRYHVAFATVPLDCWFAWPGAARIFRANRDVLSLTSHGAYHLYSELATESSGTMSAQLFEDAAARLDRFARRWGVPVSRVMVPPHGRSALPDS